MISLFLLCLLSNSIPIVRPNVSKSSFDIDSKSRGGGFTGSSTDAGAVSDTEAKQDAPAPSDAEEKSDK